MSTGGFQRVTPLGDGFIRGPARILVAPYSIGYPTSIAEVINLKGFETANNEELATEEATWKNCEQELPKAEGTEKNFYLGFGSYVTKKLGFGATGTEITAALEELPTIGSGGIETKSEAAKKITEAAYKVAFKGELKNHAQPLIQVLRNTTGKTYGPFKYLSRGYGLFDPYVSSEPEKNASNWTELGASKGGIKVMRNNTESLQDIDQIQAAVGALPDEWEMSVEAPLAETTLENIRIAWEGGTVETASSSNIPTEQRVGVGNPLIYTERRLAIIHKRTLGSSQGKLIMHLFRRVTRSAVASTIDYQKTGNMATIATNFRCFADSTVGDVNRQMGDVFTMNYF